MEIRCHHCGKDFALPANYAGAEARCPACGVMSLLRRGAVRPEVPPTANMRPHIPSDRSLRRIFEPLPRGFVYVIGAVIVVAILAPFWLVLISDRVSERPPLISADADNLPPPLPPSTPSPTPGKTEIITLPATFDQYQSVRLDAPRDALDRRFVLHLKNTRGMTPEIYESSPGPDVQRLTAAFYGNALKEFTLVFPRRSVTVNEVLQELRRELGEPRDWSETRGRERGGFGLALGGGGDEWERYPYRRQFSWFDNESRLDATIHYTATDPQECVSVLVVQVAATRWLAANQAVVSGADVVPSRGPVSPESNEPDGALRLFP